MKAGDLPIYNSLIDENKEYILEPKPDSKLRRSLYGVITPTRQSIIHWYGKTEQSESTCLRIRSSLPERASLWFVVWVALFLEAEAMDYAWNSTTSKLIEASEVIGRKYKR
ncbi:hypothetical protein TcWFU_002667 [Taenia crassiceps]|uniref:Uncharacterized protein n=1 Tax=Taenia crassiceps TaxID=6207 RepID=A0ABR4QD41_9CEST